MSWSAVRTVAVLELRQRVRSTRWQIMLVVWGVVLVLLCGGLTALAGMTGSEAEDTAPILYDLTVCFVLGIGLIIAPTLSATSVNGDRADATLALLQATRLRSQEIVVGKLVAAWSAALAFLAVALPFLLMFTLLGGAAWMTLAGHMLILVVTLGAVCAIGLGFSAATARTSASAVLTYLVVAGLVIGSPIITAISTTAVQGKQTTLSYETDYSASTNGKVVCETEPHVRTSDVVHVERIWWMLVPDPFVALADVSGRSMVYGEQSTYSEYDTQPLYPASPLGMAGVAVDQMRNPQPKEVVINHCEPGTTSGPFDWEVTHLAFWPVSLVMVLALGAWSLTSASRRLRTPARRLARGTRVA